MSKEDTMLAFAVALAVMTQPISIPESVLLKGAEDFTWGAGSPNANSVAGTLAAAMMIAGKPDYDYPYLMGISGQAFRIQFYDKDPHGSCPSSPHAMVGTNCGNRMFDVVPYSFNVVESSDPDVKAKVAECLAVGKPVIPFAEENDLAVGYRDGGKTILVRSYWDGGKKVTEMKNLPWGFSLLADKRDTKPEKDLVKESLGIALQNMKSMHQGAYATGWNAYRVWRKRLVDPWLETCTKEELSGFCHANAYIYECLFDARTQAVAYLRREALLFTGEAKRHMLEAAAQFDRVRHAVAPDGNTGSIAPYPFMLKEGQTWSPEQRKAQVERLAKIEELERSAFAELESALGAK